MDLWGGMLKGAKGLLGGIQRGYGMLYGGPDDPNLTAEQNARAKRQAMIMGGLKGLSDAHQWGGPTGIGAVASGAMAGQQLGAQTRAGMAKQQLDQQEILAVAQQLGLPPAVVARMEAPQIGELLKQQREKPSPQVLSPGGQLVDPATGRVIASGAPLPPQEWGDEVRAAAGAIGVDPDAATPEQFKQILATMQANAKARAATTTVNLPSNAVAKGMSESAVKRYDDMTTNALGAMDLISNYDMMESLITSGQVQTGKLDALTMPLRELAVSLGYGNEKTVERLGAQQLVRGIANKLALGNRKEMPGPLSNQDVRFLTQIVPGLANTAQGNLMLIQAGKKISEWRIAMAQEFESYVQEHPDGLGWIGHLEKWSKANRLNLMGDLYGDFR